MHGGTNSYTVISIVDNGCIRETRATIVSGCTETGTTLLNKISLILRLPVPCTVSSTRHFTCSSIRVLGSLKTIASVSFNDRYNDVDLLRGTIRTLCSRGIGLGLGTRLGGNMDCPTTEFSTMESIFKTRATTILSRPGGVLTMRCVGTLGTLSSSVGPRAMGQANTSRSSSRCINGVTSTSGVERLVHDGTRANLFLPSSSRTILAGRVTVKTTPSSVGEVKGTMVTSLGLGAPSSFGGVCNVNRKVRGHLLSTTTSTQGLARLCSFTGAGHFARSHVQHIILGSFFNVAGSVALSSPPCVHILKFARGNGSVLQVTEGGTSLPVIVAINSIGGLKNLSRELCSLRYEAASVFGVALPGVERDKASVASGLIEVRWFYDGSYVFT